MPDKNILALVNRYKQAGKNSYFDADEFGELAEYYDSIDELETAREIIDKGLSIHPGNLPLLIKKAKLIVYDGEYRKALKLLENISEYDFDLYLLKIECYLQLELYREAFEQSEELIEKEDNESLDNILSELGFLHIEADCFKEAALYFEESLKYNTENIEVLSDLAYCYEMLGDFDSAIDTSNKILDIEPYTYEAWVNIGKLYSLTEEYEKAIDAFEFALTINDSDNNVIKLKAHCLLLSGRIDEAVTLFKELLESDINDTTIYFLLAESFQALELYDEALSYLDQYEQSEGITSELIVKKAYLFLEKEDYNTASDIVYSYLKENPESVDLNILAGEIYFKQEKFEDAEVHFLNAYALNKENFHLIDRLGVINIKKEDYEEAAHFTKILLELDPDNLSIKQRLVLLYFEIDDKEQFNDLLNQFSDKELLSLFNLIYASQSPDYFNREMLISYLNKAREARILFKNLKY